MAHTHSLESLSEAMQRKGAPPLVELNFFIGFFKLVRDSLPCLFNMISSSIFFCLIVRMFIPMRFLLLALPCVFVCVFCVYVF